MSMEFSTEMDFSSYDFLDFGCSTGGSMKFAAATFGGKGLGIDIDSAKVVASRNVGYDAIVADITSLDPARMGTVRYVMMSHFMEHLPNIRLAEKCVLAACRMSREFVFVQQPYFDADGYLFERGFKLYWSHWRGHTLHMSMLQLQSAFEKARSMGLCDRYIIGRRFPIANSTCKEVHPLSSGIDQFDWDPGKHGPKPHVEFKTPVFRELFGLALHARELSDPALLRILRKVSIVFDSGIGGELQDSSPEIRQ